MLHGLVQLLLGPEAATGGVLQEKAFLEISLNSQEITCARASFLTKLQAFRKSGTLRWDQVPRVGHLGGTLWCGETLKWDPKVKARRTVLIHIKEIVLYLVY